MPHGNVELCSNPLNAYRLQTVLHALSRDCGCQADLQLIKDIVTDDYAAHRSRRGRRQKDGRPGISGLQLLWPSFLSNGGLQRGCC